MSLAKLRLGYEVFRQFGPLTGAYRVRYALWRKSGLLGRRFPARGWDAKPLGAYSRPDLAMDTAGLRRQIQDGEARFFFPPGKPPAISPESADHAVGEAEAVLAGRLIFFSRHECELGYPFDWFLNPCTGRRTDAGAHWCDRQDFDPDFGDIKYVWEASRFSWACTLSRAFAATRDDKYAAAFWRQFESWRDANPPNMGPAWQCGQECAFRMMAMLVALHAMWDAPATTDERVAALVHALAVMTERIEGNLAYAVSQKNNHAVSEALALFTMGTLFPFLRDARRWHRKGKRLLEREAIRQISADGGYSQQSFNYTRVMLHDYNWALALMRHNQISFEPIAAARIRVAAWHLYQHCDLTSGRVPNYGANDGALVLPLTTCDYLDYRPALGTMHHLLDTGTAFPPGMWDEEAAWLGVLPDGAAHAQEPEKKAIAPNPGAQLSSSRFDASGFYTLRDRRSDSWVFMRCHTFRSRPAQCDMLHVDLWWRGLNVLRDGGTYSYNTPPPWNSFFRGTAAHNTVMVAGREQMIKGPRFLWYDWARAKLLSYVGEAGDRRISMSGELYNYQKPCGVLHRRAVSFDGAQTWTIKDELIPETGTHATSFALHWRCPDVDWRWEQQGCALTLLTGQGPIRMDISRSDGRPVDAKALRGAVDEEEGVCGWESLYYGERLPVPTVRVAAEVELPFHIVTTVTLGA